MRNYTQTLTVQRATLTDDGLSTVQTWASDGTVTGVFLPASKSLLERAGLLGARGVHQLLLPRGITVQPPTTRFVSGATTYEVRDVEAGPRFVSVLVQVSS